MTLADIDIHIQGSPWELFGKAVCFLVCLGVTAFVLYFFVLSIGFGGWDSITPAFVDRWRERRRKRKVQREAAKQERVGDQEPR